jgi:PHP family Zn ribbon phosphoesterase
LPEIISEVLKVGVNSKAVNNEYLKLLENLGTEFKILMETPLNDIERTGSPLLREAISRMRKRDIHIAPGYDGEFGKIKIFEEVERKKIKGQTMLF